MRERESGERESDGRERESERERKKGREGGRKKKERGENRPASICNALGNQCKSISSQGARDIFGVVSRMRNPEERQERGFGLHQVRKAMRGQGREQHVVLGLQFEDLQQQRWYAGVRSIGRGCAGRVVRSKVCTVYMACSWIS